jgi:hypothetical protein
MSSEEVVLNMSSKKRWLFLKRGNSIRTCPLARGGCITASSIVLLIEAIIRSCDLSVQIIFVPITTQDIQFLSACVFVALLMWFNVVVGTNIVNHYHFIYNLSWNENIKKTKDFYQLIYFIFINLHTIQYIIYILLLTYYRISNTDTINELYKQTKIKVVFDTKTHVSITFLILFSSSRL